MKSLSSVFCASALATSIVAAAWPNVADACGCLSPPDPATLGSDDFAVNQQSESILFEVGQDTVTAHVLIRYAGEPESFAWLVPVPNAPELALSEQVTFALVEQGSAVQVALNQEQLCPVPEYQCQYHQSPSCGDQGVSGGDDAAGGTGGAGGDLDGGGDDGNGGEPPPGVDVIDMQKVGSYETVTFAADDPGAAVTWLQDNGFIVNDTMTPYMQPYIDAGMVFVAAKLEAGAGIDAIAPLKMTYQGNIPMIPLQLTAVAAEPHLTVSAYIFADTPYAPDGHPEITIPEEELGFSPDRRSNYPMLMARKIDEAGGDAWVREYSGSTFGYAVDDPSGCCGSEGDSCGVGFDGLCQCPLDAFDADDCGLVEGLVPGIDLLEGLNDNYAFLTRLTTRVSPEEMDYDPAFAPGDGTPLPPVMTASRFTLDSCEADVIDKEAHAANVAVQPCAAVYCGAGECVVTELGAGCRCDEGQVARTFTDLDGETSVTCVPVVRPVDLGANTTLPDTCSNFDCGEGSCVDLSGFPGCDCNAGSGMAVSGCATVTTATGSAGADNYSRALQELDVCAPAPPTCGEFGWLVPVDVPGIHGVSCESSIPTPDQLVVPRAPTCEDIYGESSGSDGGCGCVADSRGGTGGVVFTLLALLGLRLRRRRD